VDVPEGARRALVPRFVLQPLVENALQHGIGARQGPGCVTVTADRRDGRLVLVVADDGGAANLGSDGFPREGVGLTNTRQRLRERYGDEHRIELARGPQGGLTVALEIPFRTAEALVDA
jgi:LytS/YehU family sensor histidine kinase